MLLVEGGELLLQGRARRLLLVMVAALFLQTQPPGFQVWPLLFEVTAFVVEGIQFRTCSFKSLAF